MTTKNMMKASDFVMGVLRAAKIEEDGLTLNSQLTPKEYKEVDKFLKSAGAIWKRNQKRHLFEPGAKERLQNLLNSGEMLNEKKHFQSYYTPEAIAEEVVELAGITESMCVLEPSAGHGAIAKAILKKTKDIVCIEIDPSAVKVLKENGFNTIEGNFLEWQLPRQFDRVVMNPPFTAGQDIEHVMNAYRSLKPDGVLVAIMSPSFTFSTVNRCKEFRKFLDVNGEILMELPEGTFKESGTNIRTIVIRLRKQ